MAFDIKRTNAKRQELLKHLFDTHAYVQIYVCMCKL